MSETSNALLYIAYLANIVVAGWVSYLSLFKPQRAKTSIFQDTVEYSESIRLIGCLWAGIFLLSIVGLAFPKPMSVILLFQVVYKGTWLMFVAFPAIREKKPYPHALSIFFLVWVVLMPLAIPWGYLFA